MRWRRMLTGAMTALLFLLAAAAPAGAARDSARPGVVFTTRQDTILLGAPAESDWTSVRGSATDAASGVKKVIVTFCANARRLDGGGWTCGSTGPAVLSPLSQRKAAVSCEGGARRRCRWSVTAPLEPGSYLVVAKAVDRSGNSRSAGPLFITVV